VSLNLRVRRLGEADQSFVSHLDCGSARFERDVAKYLREWIWEEGEEKVRQRSQTLLGYDAESGSLVGYGTWDYIEELGGQAAETHLEVAWFGLDKAFQGQRDETSGEKLADLLYSTLEDDARASLKTSDDMPFTLACDVENQRGRYFWERHGYRLIGPPYPEVEDARYYRMVR